jgi:predicted phage terminase large subunit-like protein
MEFSRDLDVCSRPEIMDRWAGSGQKALEGIISKPLSSAVAHDHNPIYRMAERYWFDNDPSLLYAPLHKDRLCGALWDYSQDSPQRWAGLEILIQRESFKSTFTHGVYANHLACRARRLFGKDIRIALIHHREQQASANLQRLKRIATSHPRFKQTWPEFSSPDDFGTSLQFDWPCRTNRSFSEPNVLATGLGANLVGLHFDWMLYSDPVTDKHISSKTIRDAALLDYEADRFMLDSLSGKEVIDGTRYHIHDLHGKNLKAKAKDGSLLYKQLVVGAGTNADNLTFPTRHTLAFLEQRRQEYIARTGNDFLWWLQYQNEVKASNMVVGDWTWVRECSLRDIPPTAWRVILVDPAWKGTQNAGEGDDAAIEVWAVEQRGNLLLYYFIDGTISNLMTGEDGKAEIFRFMRKYGVIDVAPEERGGYSFRTALQNDAASRGQMINVINLETSGQGKPTRISTFLGAAQRGQVFVADSVSPSVLAKFRSQYEDHPQNEHDDALDCAAYICDPAIAKNYAPVFNTFSGDGGVEKPWWVKADDERRAALSRTGRTLHCGL